MRVNVNYAAVGVMFKSPCGSWRVLCDACLSIHRPQLHVVSMQWERSE